MNNHTLQNFKGEPITHQNERSAPARTQEVPFIAGCSFTRKNTRFRAPASSPTQAPRKIHAAITMRFATCDSTSATNYAHMNNHTLQNSKGEPITHRNGRSAPAAHRRYLSLPPAATLHGKTQGFVLRLPPQNTPHAT